LLQTNSIQSSFATDCLADSNNPVETKYFDERRKPMSTMQNFYDTLITAQLTNIEQQSLNNLMQVDPGDITTDDFLIWNSW
jgi:hypothetical protein